MRILELVTIGNFLNFMEFVIQIKFVDCIKVSYLFVRIGNLKVHIVKANFKHFDRIPSVAVEQNSQVVQ